MYWDTNTTFTFGSLGRSPIHNKMFIHIKTLSVFITLQHICEYSEQKQGSIQICKPLIQFHFSASGQSWESFSSIQVSSRLTTRGSTAFRLVSPFLYLSRSAAKYLSSLQLLPASLRVDLLQLFLGLPLPPFVPIRR
jgi:hypothetical protein